MWPAARSPSDGLRRRAPRDGRPPGTRDDRAESSEGDRVDSGRAPHARDVSIDHRQGSEERTPAGVGWNRLPCVDRSSDTCWLPRDEPDGAPPSCGRCGTAAPWRGCLESRIGALRRMRDRGMYEMEPPEADEITEALDDCEQLIKVVARAVQRAGTR